MTNYQTDKQGAARGQLETAISLFFSAGDPFAIHTLASAAFRILRDLAESSGNSNTHQSLMDTIRPGMEATFWNAVNKPANFLKHAKSDPNGVLEISDANNELVLGLSCIYWRGGRNERNSTIDAFFFWFATLYPDLLNDTAPEKEVFFRPGPTHIRSMPRSQQLAFGVELIAAIQKERIAVPKSI